MSQLDDLYGNKILELAAAIPHLDRLAHPHATATAHSKLCGSTITVDLVMKNGRVAQYGQTVKACLLGQASASVMGREIIGSTPDELREIGRIMRRMLKEDGPHSWSASREVEVPLVMPPPPPRPAGTAAQPPQTLVGDRPADGPPAV